jgi:hypothetical protein
MPKKRSAPKKRRIKTAICVDPMGCGWHTPEEEIESHIKYASSALDATLDWYQIHCIGPSYIKPGTELVIFDFGGMSCGNYLMACNSRELIKWALDHPDALVLVASGFTYSNGVQCEMEALGFAKLPNVIDAGCISDEIIPEWFKTGKSGPASVPEAVCMRCEHLISNPLYGAGEAHICSKCLNLVCGACWEEKKSICGDCAKW